MAVGFSGPGLAILPEPGLSAASLDALPEAVFMGLLAAALGTTGRGALLAPGLGGVAVSGLGALLALGLAEDCSGGE